MWDLCLSERIPACPRTQWWGCLLENSKDKKQHRWYLSGLKGVKITRGSFPPGSPQKKCGKQSICGQDTHPRIRRFSPARKKGLGRGGMFASQECSTDMLTSLCYLHRVANALHLWRTSGSCLTWEPLSSVPVPDSWQDPALRACAESIPSCPGRL